MLLLYRLVLYLALPVVVVKLLMRTVSNNQYLSRIPHRFGYKLDSLPAGRKNRTVGNHPNGIWIHAVSVGEVNAAGPLVKRLLEHYPGTTITVTTMTPTGSDRVEKLFSDSVHHCYLPYDYPGAVTRFLELVNPALAMVMETEIWPNLITECHSRGIPMIYTNVRLSARSHRGYARFRGLFDPVLKMVSCFAVQAKADADRLQDLGAKPQSVEVTGSIKFEMTLPASVVEAAQSVRRYLGWDRPVWVAGSTHEGEESQVIEAFLQARSEISNLLLVLVPRHPERFGPVSRLCARHGCRTMLRSASPAELPSDIDIYLGDTMGDLALLISAGDIAFIGGSLVPIGGHNVLEACAAGKAVVFGPHMFNFQEISNLVLSKGAGVQVMDSNELGDVLVKLLNDPVLRDQYGSEGKMLIEENRGALDKIFNMVKTYYSALPGAQEI
jgi:3-deoxy-D-manno-octulosonic-acid transferase